MDGCSHALAHYTFDFPTWAGFAKIAYQDTGHSIFYIGRATELAGQDYWLPDPVGGRFTARRRYLYEHYLGVEPESWPDSLRSQT